ncbi:MAG: FapA family protein [Peptococcaceae bacterium]
MGFYKLEKQPEGLYLTFTSDQKGLTEERILQLMLKELELRNVKIDPDEFNGWYRKKQQESLKVGDGQGSDLKAKYDINISADLLTAYLTIFPALDGKHKLSLAEVKAELINKGITFGVDDVKIMIAIAENSCVIDLPVAKGRVAVPGNNSVINYHFHEKGINIKPQELENGNVDFYNIRLIQSVEKGQLLVEKIPATKGIPGMTVTGKEIPALNGKDIILPLGKNLVASEDYLKGFAACEGHVVIVDRRVSVLPVYEVDGDVDFSTGNIDFIGNVVVKGNIKEGFTVKAKGDIEVFGTVEGGNISSSGNIVIKKGIRGLKKSLIEAVGSIYSNFIEYANVTAGGDLIVNEAIMHSTINAGLTIQVGGRKGLVVGGTCRAGNALICKNIGSNLATITTVEVGIKPELRMQFLDVTKNLAQLRENLDKTTKGIRLLRELKERHSRLPSDKEILLTKLLGIKKQLDTQQEDLTLHKMELETQIKELEDGFIKISGVINCGVNVTIGRAYKQFTYEMYKVMLRQKGVDISISPLEEAKEGAKPCPSKQ